MITRDVCVMNCSLLSRFQECRSGGPCVVQISHHICHESLKSVVMQIRFHGAGIRYLNSEELMEEEEDEVLREDVVQVRATPIALAGYEPIGG